MQVFVYTHAGFTIFLRTADILINSAPEPNLKAQ